MKNWFLQKNDSEQKIIVILAIFILLILLYTFLYLPLKKNNQQLQNSIADIQSEIATMQGLQSQLAQFSNNTHQSLQIEDSQLMTLIEEIAAQQQVTLSNIKSPSKNKIAVTLENVEFNAAMRWLDVLQTEYSINISQLTVTAEKKGLTNITAVINH
jgi:type II secretory pathway component PulM